MKTALILPLFFLFSQLQAANTTSNTQASSTTASTTSTQFDLKSQMPKNIQKQTGINRLSPKELQGLQTWISDYVQKKTTSQDTIKANQVSVVLSEGQYVKLGNGDIWTISPNAWLYTYYWQKGDPVTIGKSGDVLFPIQLTNGDSGQSVNAQKPSKQVSAAFKQSYQITKILEDGQFVELSNGSSWQVETSTRYMVQGWSVGNTVFVVKQSLSTGVPYQLYNGDTARSVFVEQMQAASKPKTKRKTQPVSTQKQLNRTNASQNIPQEPQG